MWRDVVVMMQKICRAYHGYPVIGVCGSGDEVIAMFAHLAIAYTASEENSIEDEFWKATKQIIMS